MFDDGKQTVRPSHVDDDLQGPHNEGEDGDGFGHTCDRSSPFRAGHTQDGRNQSPGMADPDEKNKVDHIHAPVDRTLHARLSQAQLKLPEIHDNPPADHGQQHRNQRPEAPAGPEQRSDQLLAVIRAYL